MLVHGGARTQTIDASPLITSRSHAKLTRTQDGESNEAGDSYDRRLRATETEVVCRGTPLCLLVCLRGYSIIIVLVGAPC